MITTEPGLYLTTSGALILCGVGLTLVAVVAGRRCTERTTGASAATVAVLSSLITHIMIATPPAANAASQEYAAPGDLPGWTRDFVDDFDGPLDTRTWGRYQSVAPGQQLWSRYDRDNVYTHDGDMVIRTHKTGNGDWHAGGVSSARGFSAVQGKWAARIRFDRAYGIGYAFLLYPKGGGWPPEVDIAEGTAGGPRIMSTLHWSPDNQTESRFIFGHDMTHWHTYGVILSDSRVEFTIDGDVWATINNTGSPTVPMWIGFQTGAKRHGTHELVDARTPGNSRVYIDWIAHWIAA